MIRLKQTMGNTIKCKVDQEYTISKYECSILSTHRLNGLFDFKIDKGAGIVYSGETKKNLSEKIESGIDEKCVATYIRQIGEIILDIQKLGLDSGKLIFNPDWIFLDKDESILKFLYCPVNGAALNFDGVLFMRDFIFQASLNGNMRQKWNCWLDDTMKSGITERRLEVLSSLCPETKISSRKQSRVDDDGEALTGVENEYSWEDNFEEAATGAEQIYSWDEYKNNEDDEAPTGMDEDCIFSGSNFGDGTYSESTKEPFSHTGMKMIPQLVQISTGESKRIIKNEFKIGRSEQRADFCIRGNSGVSNIHATIVAQGGKYYLKDNHSTNGTFLDGVKITDNSMQMQLRNGSIIRVYNEELEFRV